jgi:signal transduction histidine kinase
VKRIGQTRIEWALLAVIALVCVVLSFLQYRWTGELSRAEPALLRAGLNEQLRRLVEAFNNDIRESCTTLLPDAREIRELGTGEAHRIRFLRWASSHDTSLFTRIGIVAPEQGKLALYGMESEGRIAPMEWPPNWQPLRSAMTARITGSGRPPNARPDSNVIELPLFAASGSELEWMIFDLNEDYVRTRVMPRLVAEYLNPASDAVYDVSVSWSGPGGQVIFSTRTDHSSVASEADATAGIFSAEMGIAAGRGGGRFPNEGRLSRWTIAVRHRAGSLDAAVSRARTRNLFASLLLVGLLGGTAWALVHYTARSRRLSDMQFRFAAGVSHDLRTPLTAIRGAAFNVAEGVVEEPATIRHYARLILRNAEELTSMIENVLAFSASLHSDKDERRESVAVGNLLEHAAATMMPEIEQAGCHIEVTVAPGLPAVAGDPVAVELVFRNLIGNALRHGAGGKWIGVSAAPFGDGVEVRVCDHGPGIPEAERERIFEPFYRGEQTRAQRVPGTGLGLSLVKNTVERYQGTVQVHNSPGGGAQFTVRLPVLPESV